MQIGYYRRLENDVRHWVDQGLIDGDTGRQLVAHSRVNKRSYSFSTIVIMLGVVCLGFAAMTFVAANWNEMAKITRVGLLLASMWASYAIAVYSQKRGHPYIADAFVLLGCAVFGATIMLVGQMYHLQGNTKDAVLLWALGTFVAAAILRATSALWLAVGLFTLWLILGMTDSLNGREIDINYLFLLAWLACAALAWWLKSRMSAHLLVIALIIWTVFALMVWTDRFNSTAFVYGAYAGLFLLIALAILSFEGLSTRGGQPLLNGFEVPLIGYAVICIIAVTTLWVGTIAFEGRASLGSDLIGKPVLMPMFAILLLALGILGFGIARGSPSVYDLAFCAIWIAVGIVAVSSFGARIPFFGEAFGLGLSIWFIRMGDRQEIFGVKRLGYLAFAMVMLLIYFRTAGSLLGTSGFYLTAGVLMVLGAIFLPRLFNRKAEVGQ